MHPRTELYVSSVWATRRLETIPGTFTSEDIVSLFAKDRENFNPHIKALLDLDLDHVQAISLINIEWCLGNWEREG